jgi:hypothetical protein
MPRKSRKDMLNPRKKLRKGEQPKPKPWYDEDKFIVNLRKSMKVGKKVDGNSESN